MKELIPLTAREYDGEIHRYREDEIADIRNLRVVPMCQEDAPHAKGHLREQVANSYPIAAPWCQPCANLPDTVWRTAR